MNGSGTEKGFTVVSKRSGSPAVPKAGTAPVVLLVDDEALPREAASALLRTLKYDVVIASSGNQAMEVLRQHLDRVSVAVLDVFMPGLDGVETLDALRKIKPTLPVLLSSGAAPGERVARALELPAVRFLAKPYTKRELALELEWLLPKL